MTKLPSKLNRQSADWIIILGAFVILMLTRSMSTAPIIYSSPLLVTVFLVIFGTFRVKRTVLLLTAILGLVNVIIIVLTDAHLMNFILSAATYSGFYLLIISRGEKSSFRINAWVTGLTVLVSFEVFLGISQFVRHGFPMRLPYRDFSPDVFQGTYGMGGVRLMSIISSYCFFYFLIRYYYKREWTSGAMVIISLLGMILPGSNAMILAALLSIALFLGIVGIKMVSQKYLSRRMSRNTLVSSLFVLFIFGLSIVIFISFGSPTHIAYHLSRMAPARSETISEDVRKIERGSNINMEMMTGVEALKALSHFRTLFDLPWDAPYQPLLGVGLGNYSSWSQMILSMEYRRLSLFGTHVSKEKLGIIPTRTSSASRKYVMPYVEWKIHHPNRGSIANSPWSSWQSLYGETGFFGLLIFGFIVLVHLQKCFFWRDDIWKVQVLKITLLLSTIFFVLAGFIDNYFEYPWLTVPYFLGLVIVPGASAQNTEADNDSQEVKWTKNS